MVSSNRTLNNSFEEVSCCLDVKSDSFLFDIGITDNHHDVSRGGELVDKSGEFLISDDH